MKSSKKLPKIRASLSLPICLIAFGLIYGPTYLISVFTATLLHELGHVAAIYLSHGSISEIVLRPFGAVIKRQPVSGSYLSDLFISLSGPIMNIISFGICAFIGKLGHFAAASLILASVNLIPSDPLDGYSALRAFALLFFPPDTAERICKTISLIILGVIWIFTVYFTIYAQLNIYLLIMITVLIFGTLTSIR